MAEQATLLALVVLTGQATIQAVLQGATLPACAVAFACYMPVLLTAFTIGLLAAVPCVALTATLVANWLAIC
jgi:hypothetical protein